MKKIGLILATLMLLLFQFACSSSGQIPPVGTPSQPTAERPPDRQDQPGGTNEGLNGPVDKPDTSATDAAPLPTGLDIKLEYTICFSNRIIRLTYHNQSDQSFMIGEEFNLQAKEAEGWQSRLIARKGETDLVFRDIGFTLEPDRSYVQTFNLDQYNLRNLDEEEAFRFSKIIHSGDGSDSWQYVKEIGEPTNGTADLLRKTAADPLIDMQILDEEEGFKSIQVKNQSNSKNIILSDDEFYLQQKKGSEWEDLPTNMDYLVWQSLSTVLQPGESTSTRISADGLQAHGVDRLIKPYYIYEDGELRTEVLIYPLN